MKVWAIRHKPTDRFMPARMFSTKARGWSYWEPTVEGYQGVDGVPRLFVSENSVRHALTAWLMGIHKHEHVSSFESLDFSNDGDVYVLVGKPQVPRVRQEMEIVEFELRELQVVRA